MGRKYTIGLAALVFSVVTMLATTAMAQEEAPVEEEGTMDFALGEDDGGSLDFDLEETEEIGDQEGPALTGLIIRAEGEVEASVPRELTAVLLAELRALGSYTVTAPNEIQEQFAQLGEQGTLDCVYNPICLSRVGAELKLAKLVIGRISGVDGDYSLSIDLIDVETGTVEDYTNRTVKGGSRELKETVGSSVKRLFDVRERKKKVVEQAPVEMGPVQTGLAWGTLGVGVVCIGAGVYFGLEASSIESDLEQGARREVPAGSGRSVYAITPKAAQAQLDEADSNALLANVMYGVGIAAGVTSALLFMITPGSDIATEEELAEGGIRDIRIAPIFTETTAGVGAGFSF